MPSSLNGTGVTFNDGSTLQSGNIPAANLGSGSPSSANFLRGDRTWQSLSVPSTEFDGVGSYVLALYGINMPSVQRGSHYLTRGTTVAGSSLRVSSRTTGFVSNNTAPQEIQARDIVTGFSRFGSEANYTGGGAALSGTYRLMTGGSWATTQDNYVNTAFSWNIGLWVRVS